MRGLSTGKILSFGIKNPEILQESNLPLMVVDDLCDAGGTFIGTANSIREISPNREINIYITHMVNPKGIINLSKNYNKVIFTNSYKSWEREDLPSNVKVIDVL